MARTALRKNISNNEKQTSKGNVSVASTVLKKEDKKRKRTTEEMKGSSSDSLVTTGKKSARFSKKNKPEIISALDGNPYYNEVLELKNSTRFWKTNSLFADDIRKAREQEWDFIEKHSHDLCEKYAWAIPDEACLRIVAEFSPLIELGAGRGYWSRLLSSKGADVIAVDKYSPLENDSLWYDVKVGDASILAKSEMKNRNLFLCYPDDRESMAIAALESFQGEYILYIGEMLFTNGSLMGAPIAPFGRTSSAEFQVSLAEAFHCVLVKKLSLTYPISSNDCLSVWKRNSYVRGKEVSSLPIAAEELEEEPAAKKSSKKSKKQKQQSASSGDGVEYINLNELAQLREMALDQQYNEDEEAKWTNIPENEILPVDRAAPFLQHLL
jgi:hypothetical protein